ncbi:acyl-CoA thioesterase [Catenovulum sp. SM1970]|nr:acyl-CoA thioesterase [Marinifaba aquimaris]NTS78555.1 acyl-CoA thioesterase [Marinifaba aquimaris]
MPADTNANGDIFGGWIMSQLDIAGGMMAKAITRSRTVTVAVDNMLFLKPIKVGDIVCCYGSIKHTGNTSLSLELEVWVEPILRNCIETDRDGCAIFKVVQALYTYVAIDDLGNKHPIKRNF